MTPAAILRAHADALDARASEHRADHARTEGQSTRRRYRYAASVLRDVAEEIEDLPADETWTCPRCGSGGLYFSRVLEDYGAGERMHEHCGTCGLVVLGEGERRPTVKEALARIHEVLKDADLPDPEEYLHEIGRCGSECLRCAAEASPWRRPPELPEDGVAVIVALDIGASTWKGLASRDGDGWHPAGASWSTLDAEMIAWMPIPPLEVTP